MYSDRIKCDLSDSDTKKLIFFPKKFNMVALIEKKKKHEKFELLYFSNAIFIW